MSDARMQDPPIPATGPVFHTIRRLAVANAAACVFVVLCLVVGRAFSAMPADAGATMARLHAIARTAAQTGAAGAALGTLLLALTGELACLAMLAAARAPTERPDGLLRLAVHAALRRPPAAAAARRRTSLGTAARSGQGTLVPLMAAVAGATAWALRPTLGAPSPADAMIVGAALLVLAFPALVAERTIAAIRPTAFADASALRALLLLPVVGLAIAAGVALAIGLGVDAASWVGSAVCGFVVLAAIELALRALGRWFLPPPPAAAARPAVTSLLAAMLAGSFTRGGIGAPIRAQLGIDFARSWALAYLRAASTPALLLTGVLCWGLTGLTAVDLDQRGVYERFGAPVAVLQSGLQFVLPWPFGAVRRVERGTVHELTIGGAANTAERVAAEAPAPASADRLWDQPHPGEVTYLIASQTDGRQGFQTVSADIRVLYRIGLDDADALHAAYATADPQTLVRETTGRRLAQFFAARTLDDVLGEQRERMADALRAAVAADLAPLASGVEIVAVVVEAVHPPTGAAAAYHAVQAAAIEASTSIAAEQGRAKGTANGALQEAHQLGIIAQGAAAETVQAARADTIRFDADRAAASVGGKAFLIERYLGNVTTALAKAPLTIVDNRLDSTNAPVIDLRPIAGASTMPEDPD